jgi:amino-acid N-acetyltransferase
LEQADAAGIEEVYLLTTTAEKYFPRFGFNRTARSAVPEAVKASAEFQGACPDTAVVMKRLVGAAARARA